MMFLVVITVVPFNDQFIIISEKRQPSIDNPLYDMQILGGSTNELNTNKPTSLTRSYENVRGLGSPTTTSVPSSPTSEEHVLLLSGSKSSTGGSTCTSPNRLDVPVFFNALNNRQRGTRSRVTFMDRTPSPQPDRKIFPGISEEYEPISPSAWSEPNSPRDSTTDETMPMIRLDNNAKKDSGSGGYENATLTPSGKLRTKKRDYPGYENSSPDVTGSQGSNEVIYDYAEVGFQPSSPTSPTSSIASDKSPVFSPTEYAIPGTHKFNIPKLKPVKSRHGADSSGSSSGNQYNTLDSATATVGQSDKQQGDGEEGEYCKLRREGNEITKAKEALKSLPDVIRVVPKPR